MANKYDSPNGYDLYDGAKKVGYKTSDGAMFSLEGKYLGRYFDDEGQVDDGKRKTQTPDALDNTVSFTDLGEALVDEGRTVKFLPLFLKKLIRNLIIGFLLLVGLGHSI